MTRKSLSITQEQLCRDICSAETLSRIENGSQNPNRDTYELLMERMGRVRERAYSMLSVNDFKILDIMKHFDDCIRIYDYQQAEHFLEEIKNVIGSSVLDKQYLIRAETLVSYRLKSISAEEYLEGFEKAILLTIPKYGTISLSNWPLSYIESQLLINISGAYGELKDYPKAIEVLEEAYHATMQSYLDEQRRAQHQIVIINNLSKFYGLMSKHEKAMELAKEGIALCIKSKLGSALPNLVYSIAWNIEQLMALGLLPEECKKEALSYIKQAYYIASAMQQPFLENFFLKHVEENYTGFTGIISGIS
jgi:transcriptional regulator with XRE-family HTH domain